MALGGISRNSMESQRIPSIPLVFLWHSFGIPLVFLWHPFGIPLVTQGIPKEYQRNTKGILGIRWIPVVPQKACIISRDHLEFQGCATLAHPGNPLNSVGTPKEFVAFPRVRQSGAPSKNLGFPGRAWALRGGRGRARRCRPFK